MSNNLRGSKRVSAYLDERGIEARVVTLDESTRTSQLAADALGCTVAEIAKSIVFKAGEGAVVVVISGDRRVDAKKVSAHLGVKVGNADADAVKALTGYAIGGVPPFPHDRRREGPPRQKPHPLREGLGRSGDAKLGHEPLRRAAQGHRRRLRRRRTVSRTYLIHV